MEATGSLKEKVYTQLMQDITEGKLKPNEIITEGSLMKQFSVSKAPVREALIELCKDGFLRSLPRLGYQIIACSLKEIIDILDFRVDLETSNLRRAFARITADDLKVFDKYSNRINKVLASNSIAENWLHNQNFHLTLCTLSTNAYAYRTLEQLLKQNARFFGQYYNYAWYHESESKGRFHQSIIDALTNKNLEEACALLATDINTVKEQIQKVIMNGGV